MCRHRRFKKERRVKVIPKDNIVDWNFENIKKIAEQNNIQMFVKANGQVLEFKSKYDKWMCSTSDQRFLKLYHDTKSGGCHLQNTFFDCLFMLNSTKSHDWFKQKIRGSNVVDNVLYKSMNGKIPRFKVN